MFYLGSNEQVKLKKDKNSVQTINTINFKNNYWDFTKKKIIWSRKSDKIKNEIDYDNKMIEKIKKVEKIKLNEKALLESSYKVNMFDKLNKFKKYDSLVVEK